MTNFTQ